MRTAIECVADTIRAGGVVAYPTEGVWGLGCDPSNEAAIKRLLALKQRRMARGLILLAANETQLAPFIKPLSPSMSARIKAPRSIPTTWLVPAANICPDWLTGGRATLAVRITVHPPARDLALAAGMALVSTSANRHGAAPAANVSALRAIFGNALDAILDAPLGGAAGPSEIRDAITDRIIRPASTEAS